MTMTPGEAVMIVAHHIIHDALAYYGEDGDERDAYPEIGEGDWELIVAAVRALGDTYASAPRLASDPSPLRDALDVLRERAS